jgi:hypothetical protein
MFPIILIVGTITLIEDCGGINKSFGIILRLKNSDMHCSVSSLMYVRAHKISVNDSSSFTGKYFKILQKAGRAILVS